MRNATRAKDHLLRCVWALELFPEMPTRLRSAPNRQSPSSSPGHDLVLPSLSPEILALWRSQFARVQLRAGLKFSRFDTAEWRSLFLLVSGGRFDGPGGRRTVGGPRLTESTDESDKEVCAYLGGYHSLSASTASTELGEGVFNVVLYTPVPLLVATFRRGSEPATAENLFGHLQESLNGPLTANVATDSAEDPARGATPMSLFKSRRLLAVVTDSPSNMVALRTQAVARGTFLLAFGCAAHAANLVAQDAARVPQIALALRAALLVTVFFTRSTRAHALLKAVRAGLEVGGGRRDGSLRAYSRTRWAGERSTFASVGANLPALRHTLLENTHSAAPFEVSGPGADDIRSPTIPKAMDACAPLLSLLPRLVAVLEADGAPLSSYAGVFGCLRAALANHFVPWAVGWRQQLQTSLGRHFTAFSDPLVGLAWCVDPFWALAAGVFSVRGPIIESLAGRGGGVPVWRGRGCEVFFACRPGRSCCGGAGPGTDGTR